MSWLWRGFQSALFYYLSCTPCITHNQFSRIKRENRRAKRAMDKRGTGLSSDTDDGTPAGYHYTLPLQMNPGWTEERDAGPGPPKKSGGKYKKSHSPTRLNTGGQGSSEGGRSVGTGTTLVTEGEISAPGTSGTTGTNRTSENSTGSSDIRSDAPWNNMGKKRYQRPDEVLWGEDLKVEGENEPSYMRGRNPPVNDLSPPIVSSPPGDFREIAWMLQPPPPAKVMVGKVKETDMYPL